MIHLGKGTGSELSQSVNWLDRTFKAERIGGSGFAYSQSRTVSEFRSLIDIWSQILVGGEKK